MIYPLILAVIVGAISFFNYTPGTFLTGWDTLHPEFDFGLNLQRLIMGVWRSEQGLGAIAGHSHMADLPHVLLLWVMHWVMPLDTLRYAYVFICLLVGVWGVYMLIQYLCKQHRHAAAIGFIGGLLYLFHPGTLQQFYVPFEMFTTQYAYLPWILYITLRIFETGEKKWWLLFFIASVMATPQAYAAHLWYPFFGIYVLFLALYVMLHNKTVWKKSMVLIGLLIVANAYWLLPNVYFITTSSYVPKESKQNRIFSQEFRLRNRENGYLSDVALLKGFYFNWQAYDFETEQSAYLMPVWREHSKNPITAGIGYVLFTLSIAGIVVAIKKKDGRVFSFIPFMIIPFIFLMSHTPPFEQLFNLLLHIPVFEEALRFVYNKFSSLLLLAYVWYLCYFIAWITKHVSTQRVIEITIGMSAVLVFFMFPYFQGELISPRMRVSIPQSYFEFWDYMKGQEDGIVATLPLFSFSGWQYYDWGYQGAGFLWFGLRQPLLDRDFDRWSMQNEQAFRELQYAVYRRRADLFITVLQKYHISYLLWDRHSIPPEPRNRKQFTFEREIAIMIDELQGQGLLTNIRNFDAQMSLYALRATQGVVTKADIHTNVIPTYRWNSLDSAYFDQGDYVSIPTVIPHTDMATVYYPLRDVMDTNDRVRPGTVSLVGSGKFTIANQVPEGLNIVQVPDYTKTEDVILTYTYLEKAVGPNAYVVVFKPQLPQNIDYPIRVPITVSPQQSYISINGTNVIIPTGLETGEQLYIGPTLLLSHFENTIDNTVIALNPLLSTKPLLHTSPVLEFIPSSTTIHADEWWDSIDHNAVSAAYSDTQKSIRLTSYNKNDTLKIPFDTIYHNLGYILAIESRYGEGLPLRICMSNAYSGKCDVLDELSRHSDFAYDFFLVPPSDDGTGYTLSISNISFGNYPSENDIRTITLIPIQYTFLSSIYFTNTETPLPTSTESLLVHDDLSYRKVVSLPVFQQATGIPMVVLHQSYHEGWESYTVRSSGILQTHFPWFFGERMEHLLVNNWANGFRIEPDKSEAGQVVIIFWPQYLEYLGLALLGVSTTGLLYYVMRRSRGLHKA
ncbi:MAG: hypothetical protein NUV52_00800 [Candidatus Roizmanbacteria bacterium]|nr:hypothetical protein [Candidatus Roizmanbacteria bacterium]